MRIGLIIMGIVIVVLIIIIVSKNKQHQRDLDLMRMQMTSGTGTGQMGQTSGQMQAATGILGGLIDLFTSQSTTSNGGGGI